MDIILVRHGKTEYNEKKQYCGVLDPGLSAAGRAELLQCELRELLRDEPPELVFSSPMQRTLETADLLCEDFSALPLLVVSELREIDFGAFEGKSYEDLKDDPAYTAWLDTNCEGPIPGGDFPDRFREDCVIGFETVLESCGLEGVERAMVVTHGGVIGAILEHYAEPRKNWYEYETPFGGYFILHLPEKTITPGGGSKC